MFSIFDPQRIFSLSLNWISSVLVLLFFLRGLSVKNNILRKIEGLILKALLVEFKAIFGKGYYPGRLLVGVSLFVFILRNNLLGLFPHIFTASRHGVFTMALALPFWLGYIIWAFIFNFESTLAHFLPLNTPAPLAPLIVLIEVVRRVIRPLTLSIRLAANIVAGHLLLSLLSENIVGGLRATFFLVLLGLLCLIVLEFAVALIQGYVFSLLSTLYLNEANTKKFFSLGSVYNTPGFLSGKSFLLKLKHN